MTDVHTSNTRSYNMSHIRGKNTTPEILVRKFLYANGFRYRVNDKKLPGKPDIVIPKYKVIIDVRGCFWHGHKNCRFGDLIKSESILINKRIEDAKIRDERNIVQWMALGWRVIIVWDRCELEDRRKNSIKRELVLEKLKKSIKN